MRFSRRKISRGFIARRSVSADRLMSFPTFFFFFFRSRLHAHNIIYYIRVSYNNNMKYTRPSKGDVHYIYYLFIHFSRL